TDLVTEKLRSDLRRAEVLELTGQEDRAREIFLAIEKHYSDQSPQEAAQLTVVARTLVHLEKFQEAKDYYLEAIRNDSSYFEAQVSAGELFTEKYNYGEAAQFFADALQLNPNSARAHLDVAVNKTLEGGEEMGAALSRALAINPNLVDALVFKASIA